MGSRRLDRRRNRVEAVDGVSAHRPTHLRLAEKLHPTDTGCVEFTGARTPKGYGKFYMNGRLHFAHRAAWELANGPIPEGVFVLHRCDNPSCCNVDHLWLGTAADNTADMMAKRRHRSFGRTHCINGHEMTETNEHWRSNGKKLSRTCKTCSREKGREALRRFRQRARGAGKWVDE